METFFAILGVIFLAMILFSIFNKTERGQIKERVQGQQQDWARKKAEEIVKEVYEDAITEDGMDALVNIIQFNYNSNNVNAEVSRSGKELIINLLEPNLVEQFRLCKDILENKQDNLIEDIKESEKFFQMLKEVDRRTLRAQQENDRNLFLKAGLKKYTTQISGHTVNTLDYY